MYATDFAYYRAASVAEAGRLLKEHPGAKLLAGGHSLIPLLKLRLASPPALIDIGRIPELKGISSADGRLRIGALTTHADVAASTEVRTHAQALAEAAAQIGDPAVRKSRHGGRQRGARRSGIRPSDRALRAGRSSRRHRRRR